MLTIAAGFFRALPYLQNIEMLDLFKCLLLWDMGNKLGIYVHVSNVRWPPQSQMVQRQSLWSHEVLLICLLYWDKCKARDVML